MTSVTLTEFRSHASGMLGRVEHGETLAALRHGRPIAEVPPRCALEWVRNCLHPPTRNSCTRQDGPVT